ncbi:MAG: DUF4872 domain-containing protein [Anaerolineales bacterium]|nr:DUF4872 domain-containing protein [Anaerolineales bacterium]
MTKNQFNGLHYETGSVHNLLSLQGIKMPHTKSAPSEALLLGLSGGITFGYFSFAYKGLDPQVALLTRNTFDPLEKLFDRLGVVRTVKQTTDASKAENNLLDALENGQPVLVWADQISLPYNTYDGMLGEEMYMMIPIVVFGYNAKKGTVDIADQSRVPMTVKMSTLTKARARVKKEKFRQMTLAIPSFDKFAQGVSSGLRASIQSFYNSPVKGYASNFGFAAYQRWADVLINDKDKQSWNKIFPTGRPMFAGLASAFERIELFGTGGSASRPMFSDFIDEASLILDKPALRESAAQIRQLAPLWESLNKALLPDDLPLFKETRQLLFKKRELFWQKGDEAAGEIKKIHTRLKAIRAKMEKSFPLSDKEAMALKHNLREHIIQIHDAEKEAITVLEKAFVQ